MERVTSLPNHFAEPIMRRRKLNESGTHANRPTRWMLHKPGEDAKSNGDHRSGGEDHSLRIPPNASARQCDHLNSPNHRSEDEHDAGWPVKDRNDSKRGSGGCAANCDTILNRDVSH